MTIPDEDAGFATLLAMCTALATELSTTRERLDTVERLLDRRGLLPHEAVATFQPVEADAVARDRARRRLIDRIFGILKREAEREAAALAQARTEQTR